MGLCLQDIADMLDHSLLKPQLTTDEVIEGCRIARRYNCASVCCRPDDVKLCADELKGSATLVTTVVGFPHGNSLTEVKVAEAEAACRAGAVELDMVLNIGKLVSGEYDYVENEIRRICVAAESHGAAVKVIFENCYLNDEQKRIACRLSEKAGAAFVKTSTGFGMPGDSKAPGATIEDIRLMRRECSPEVRVKAAGGVRTLSALLEVREAGASRAGSTATIAIMEEAKERELEGKL